MSKRKREDNDENEDNERMSERTCQIMAGDRDVANDRCLG